VNLRPETIRAGGPYWVVRFTSREGLSITAVPVYDEDSVTEYQLWRLPGGNVVSVERLIELARGSVAVERFYPKQIVSRRMDGIPITSV